AARGTASAASILGLLAEGSSGLEEPAEPCEDSAAAGRLRCWRKRTDLALSGSPSSSDSVSPDSSPASAPPAFCFCGPPDLPCMLLGAAAGGFLPEIFRFP